MGSLPQLHPTALAFSKLGVIVPAMKVGSSAPFILVAIYVVAVALLVSSQEGSLPAPVMSSLTVRQIAFMARMAAAPALEDSKTLQAPLQESLQDIAGRPLATDKDCLVGAAAAMALDARHLTAIFVAPLAHKDKAAKVITTWAMQPGFVPTDQDIAAIYESPLDQVSKDIVVAKVAGDLPQGEAAKQAWSKWWRHRTAAGTAIALVGTSLLFLGIALWFRARIVQLVSATEERPPLTKASLGAMAKVILLFMAISLTAGILGPRYVLQLFPDIGIPQFVVGLYLVTGIAGLWMISLVGKEHPSDRFGDLSGFSSSFRPNNLLKSITWGLGGYAMIWPAVLAAAAITSIMGGTGEPFDNPIALLLVSSPEPSSLALLGFSVAILAPIIEEPLFRGFLFGRLRRSMTPYGAAILSGLIFAIAHFSLENLLPLWAIGFTLGVLYDRSKDLLAPIIAHSLWNLVTAGSLITIFG